MLLDQGRASGLGSEVYPPPPYISYALPQATVDALGLEPMAEVSDRDLGSEVDSGGTSSGSSTASSASDDEDVFLSSSEDMSFSTDVSDTRLRGTWDSDSDGFSTDVSESRKRRRGGIES